MPDFDAWLGTVPTYLKPQANIRAAAAWKRIQDKPETVAVWRNDDFDHNETVRLEWDNATNTMANTENAVTAITRVIVFGIRNHATLPNTDIVEGDEVYLGGEAYQVKDVLLTIGELQARCVRLT